MSAALKSYASPWNGRLILACKKCQKKLKSNSEHKDLAKLKKAIDKNKTRPTQEIHVLNVPCMKICPKDGVAIVSPDRSGDKLYILRCKDDIDGLINAIARP
jgi:predicted metal-binding protein